MLLTLCCCIIKLTLRFKMKYGLGCKVAAKTIWTQLKMHVFALQIKISKQAAFISEKCHIFK